MKNRSTARPTRPPINGEFSRLTQEVSNGVTLVIVVPGESEGVISRVCSDSNRLSATFGDTD